MGHYINKSWVVSPAARNVYGVCAICEVLLIVILVGTAAGLAQPSFKHADLARNILLFLTCGAATLDVAMVYFWWSFDPSSETKKVLWAGMPILTGFVGVVLYYWFVYRPATSLEAASAAVSRSR